jgi:hypothetical protein
MLLFVCIEFPLSGQVALNGWLQKNFSSVVAMFEDRFELWTIQGTTISNQHPVKGNKTKRQGGQLKQKEHPQELRFSWLQMPARRSRELKGLMGWYFLTLPIYHDAQKVEIVYLFCSVEFHLRHKRGGADSRKLIIG